MKVRRRDNVYEFETMSEDKLVAKFNEIVEIGGKIKWMIGGEVTLILFSLFRSQKS